MRVIVDFIRRNNFSDYEEAADIQEERKAQREAAEAAAKYVCGLYVLTKF